jgi:hypothetical protein
MKSLTLVIPAKHEEYSLPRVLKEMQNIDCKKIIVLSKSDSKTIRSIKNYKCKIIKQKYNLQSLHKNKFSYSKGSLIV